MHHVIADAEPIQVMQAVCDRFGDVAGSAEEREPLGGDDHILVGLAGGFQAGRHGAFGHAAAVHLGGVEPVDAAIQGGFDDGILYIRRNDREETPSRLPPPESSMAPRPMGVTLMSVLPRDLKLIDVFIRIIYLRILL